MSPQPGAENAYTHVWRAREADLPCALTGREGPDSDGRVFVEITRGDSLTFVPKEELVTFAAWKEEQARAAIKAPALREPDRDQLEIFIEAMFRYASSSGFVSLRAFYEDDATKPFRITPTSLAGGLRFLIDAAMDDARRAANAPKPVVFAPPIATFASKTGAKETDIVEGLALSVECDTNPNLARARLEAILGPATIATLSGGVWLEPANRTGGGPSPSALAAHRARLWRGDARPAQTRPRPRRPPDRRRSFRQIGRASLSLAGLMAPQGRTAPQPDRTSDSRRRDRARARPQQSRRGDRRGGGRRPPTDEGNRLA